jgi:hypothetical protein
MWAGGALPIAGADEDFAVPLAFLAMKFVNRHEPSIINFDQISSNTGWVWSFLFDAKV